MASIASIARQRKDVLKQLNVLSQKVDARQEALEREILRQIRRKRSVPEAEDMTRVIVLCEQSAQALDTLVQAVQNAQAAFQT